MRRSPSRQPPVRYERDYEEIRIAEPDYYGDDNYHNIRERDVSGSTDRYAVSRYEENYQEPAVVEKPFPRRGKTKMPSRMVDRAAITALGYPYDEEVILTP